MLRQRLETCRFNLCEQEKLADSKGLPKVQKITEKMSKRWGTGTVAIPAPMEVDAIIKKVPKGKLVTINEIREALAKKHNATIGCPITTGFLLGLLLMLLKELQCTIWM
jgi:galactitol-specific phosphotransferase system IIC component